MGRNCLDARQSVRLFQRRTISRHRPSYRQRQQPQAARRRPTINLQLLGARRRWLFDARRRSRLARRCARPCFQLGRARSPPLARPPSHRGLYRGELESASDVHGPLCRVPLRCLPVNLPCQVSAAPCSHVRRAAYNNICYIRLKLNSALPVMLCLMSGGIVRKPGVSAISACSVRAGKVAHQPPLWPLARTRVKEGEEACAGRAVRSARAVSPRSYPAQAVYRCGATVTAVTVAQLRW